MLVLPLISIVFPMTTRKTLADTLTAYCLHVCVFGDDIWAQLTELEFPYCEANEVAFHQRQFNSICHVILICALAILFEFREIDPLRIIYSLPKLQPINVAANWKKASYWNSFLGNADRFYPPKGYI